MAYPREMLNDDEDIIFERHPHWTYMLGPIAMMCLGVLVFVVIALIDVAFAWIGLLVTLLFAIGSVGRYLRWRTTEFVLTTSRIITRHGILSKHGLEIPLDRVMNISYHQSIFERLLKVGDLVIESAGELGRQLFTDVSNPAEVQNLIYKATEQDEQHSFGAPDGFGNRRHPQPGGGRAHNLSIPEQIEKLAELYAEGVLSEEEFQQSKRQLLDKM